jgi:DNA-binding MarR family transcriptional regulator
MTIDEEIHQHSWRNPFHKAVVNALYTSRFLEDSSNRLLRPYNVTHQQFNILRILRGQKDKPATVKLLVERMLDKSSNASRLVDKLLEKALVRRDTCPNDRRAVEVRISAEGLALLDRIDREHFDSQASASTVLSDEEAHQLSALLDKLRAVLRSHQSYHTTHTEQIP